MTDHPTYELLQVIGAGPLATVYRARDLNLQRDVAVKVLNNEVRSDPMRSQLLYAAAQLLAGLSHPNIVQVYGLDGDRGWLVMELLPGSLAKRLARGPLPPDLVRSVLQQALKGLQALHAQNWLHGAVKPSNLLIDDHGRVKLSDSAGLSLEGEVLRPEGVPKYMAPELINPEFGPVGPGVDLYSLGFTALELLIGRGFDRLFPGADGDDPEISWLRLHGSRGDPSQSPSHFVPNKPPDLARVLTHMLSQDVNDRYASAEEALRDLERRPLLAVVLPEAAPPPDEPQTFTTRRLPQVVSAVAAAPARRRANPARPAPPARPVRPTHANTARKSPVVLYSILGVLLVLAVAAAVVVVGMGGADAETVKLPVSSTPAGATVFIDGAPKKHTTPFTFDLPPGQHKVRVELADHEPSEREIEVKKGVEPVAFSLNRIGAPAEAPVRVLANPADATVFVDASDLHHRPGEEFKLSPGKHTFRVHRDEYKDAEKKDVDIPPGGTTINFGNLDRLTTTPPDKPVVVHVVTNPAGAAVKVDGGAQDRATPLDLELRPGRYTLDITKVGFEPLTTTLVVKENGVVGGMPPYTLKPLQTGAAEEITNGIGVKLKLIKPGTFQMGSPQGEKDRDPEQEGPQHTVEITRPFYLGVNPVTKEQFAEFAMTSDYQTEAEKAHDPSTWRNPGFNQGNTDPVVNVTWNDAMRFCQWLSKKEQKRYDLPTEAEWEYACRAGTTTAYSFGDDPTDLGGYAWHDGNAGSRTQPVGRKKPNAWGLYDMHGNVWQWCADRYAKYQKGYVRDPEGKDGDVGVLRGGSWAQDSGHCRSAVRYPYGLTAHGYNFGFRVVLRSVAGAP